MKKFEKKSAGPLERLRLRSGIYASAVTVLVVVLAVLLNLIVRAVPTKYTESGPFRRSTPSSTSRRPGSTPSAAAPGTSPTP